mgnify:FL=1|jgi:hypothetical protein
MEKTRNPRFTGVLIFAGLWNLCIATWALFFTDMFIQVLALEGRGVSKVFQTIVGISGIMFILSGLNNARFRFIIAIAVPGKILVFLGSANVLLAGQAGVGIMFIGLGDLLFTIPFIMYLRATRQFGWI